MEIVFVASEMVPFAKTGGLADVIGSLTREIAKDGHRVCVFIPKYKKVTHEPYVLKPVLEEVGVPIGSETETGSVFECAFNELKVFFVGRSEYFDRDGLYGTPMGDYPDNDRRFAFYQRVVLEALKRLKIKPDVIHSHDWQSGLIPVYLKTLYQSDPFFVNSKTVFTVHNLSYQGSFPPDSVPVTGVSWSEFRYERLELYGKMSFLKGGLIYSDLLTTVSERYAQEIQTKEFGCGLEGALAYRKADLYGIVNGIHPADWDPKRDLGLAANFGPRDLLGKRACKEALQNQNHLKHDLEAPLFAFVGRLVPQKGLDLITRVIEDMVASGWQFVLLGTGEEEYHRALRIFGERHPNQIGLNITFDSHMARQIYAGADLLLMPSQFEPCGLGQMISLRYGTIPVVRETGGLADTVQEFNPKTGKGNGFVFSPYAPKDLLNAMRRAAVVYRDQKSWTKLMQNAMACDFSWRVSARRYLDLYERAQRKPLKV
ncbi:MAG: starch synthase [Omnitrophica bacterium RIFCSPLOWO2_12_FULL_50_11]|nr:MAG: starch synthase [Omnitrophica bacterium RIFCSPLOWO2_12_FULL_50_11]